MAEQLTEDIEPEIEAEEDEEPQIDPVLAARRDAALAHVRKFGDPVLQNEGAADRTDR